ncbi:MAG: hypothetical protein M3541_09425 [Acidobacteriota bacterium]|jgi:peptidoglycan hydrolase-like amidase|nr:hypothetical protein [Acidobacteriota bacterium]
MDRLESNPVAVASCASCAPAKAPGASSDRNAESRLAIGEFSDIRVIQRRLSDRLVSTEITGTTGRATGTVVGATFFGRGWGHGVGMCQDEVSGLGKR